MIYDLAIVGGNVVFPGHGVESATIAVKDGVIAAVLAPGTAVEALETVEAHGLHVLPGIIESHSHLGIGNGLNDYVTETRSAVVGGVTTILHFLRHPAPYDDTFQTTVSAGQDKSLVDFGFHIVLLTDEHVSSLPRYVHEYGITSFKFYMTYRQEDAAMMDFDLKMKRFGGVDDGFMMSCLEAVAAEQEALLIVHAENIEIIAALRRRYQAQGRQDMAAWQASRPEIAEVEAVRRACFYATATGARMHILHLTTTAALDMIQRSRADGARIHVEVCHPYLLVHDDGTLDRVEKMKPPFRSKINVDGLWRAVADRRVDVIGSDHVPRPLAPKLGDLWTPATGAPGTPTMLPALIEEGYHRRGVPLERLIEMVTIAPARLYGLAPRKGSLQVGSDADIVVVDLERDKVVLADEIGSVAGYSLYEGQHLRGWPSFVTVRGKPVLRDGHVVDTAAGHGRYLPRAGVSAF